MIFSKEPLHGGNWSQPIDIFTGPLMLDPKVGVDSKGNAVIIATASDDQTTFYEKAVQLIQGVKSNEQNFAALNFNEGINAISVNQAGNAVVVWIENDTSTFVTSLRSVVLTNNNWDVPITISNSANLSVQGFSGFGVNLDRNNKSLTTWVSRNQTDFSTHILANQYFGGAWQGIQDIFSTNDNISSLAFSGSPSGKAIAIWIEGNPAVLQSAYFNGITWNITLVSSDVFLSSLPILYASMNKSGKAIFLWINSTRALTSVSFSKGSYGAPQIIYTPLVNESIPNAVIVLDDLDNAIALWIVRNNSSGEYKLMTSRKKNGPWTTPIVLDASNIFLTFPNIATDSNGNAYAVWEKDSAPDVGSIYYHYYSKAANTWSNSPALLSLQDIPSSQPHLAMNALSNATVVWSSQINEAQIIQAVYTLNSQIF